MTEHVYCVLVSGLLEPIIFTDLKMAQEWAQEANKRMGVKTFLFWAEIKNGLVYPHPIPLESKK